MEKCVLYDIIINMKKLPKFLEKYFWDVDFGKVSLQKFRLDIIRRILNYGDEKAVAWMFKNFKTAEMKYAVSHLRGYSRKSANYWAFVLGLPKEEVLCLKKHSSSQQKTIWPY